MPAMNKTKKKTQFFRVRGCSQKGYDLASKLDTKGRPARSRFVESISTVPPKISTKSDGATPAPARTNHQTD